MNYGDKPLEIPPQEGGTPETERSIRAITEVGLPSLRGTEADIGEAAALRLDKLIAADDLMTELRTEEQQAELDQQDAPNGRRTELATAVHRAQTALNHLRHQDDAAWWLMQRDRTARELLEMFAG